MNVNIIGGTVATEISALTVTGGTLNVVEQVLAATIVGGTLNAVTVIGGTINTVEQVLAATIVGGTLNAVTVIRRYHQYHRRGDGRHYRWRNT